MHIVRFLCALTTVQAACDGTCWIPKDGDTVQKAVDALGVDLETFREWNPDLEDVDKIYTSETFSVSSVNSLHDAVWMTRGGSRFLHLIDASLHSGHETLASRPLTWSDAASTLEQPHGTSRVDNTPTRVTPTVASATPGLQRGGYDSESSLICNPVNDGTFPADDGDVDVIKAVIKRFCSYFQGEQVTSSTIVRVHSKEDPNKPDIRYQVKARLREDCDYSQPRIPESEECQEILLSVIEACEYNKGTGGAKERDCVMLQYYPLHQDEPPEGAQDTVDNWNIS